MCNFFHILFGNSHIFYPAKEYLFKTLITNKRLICLTFFMPLVSFYIPRKHQKAGGFLMFFNEYRKRTVAWNKLMSCWMFSILIVKTPEPGLVFLFNTLIMQLLAGDHTSEIFLTHISPTFFFLPSPLKSTRKPEFYWCF